MVAVRCDVVRCQGLEISHIQHIHTAHTYARRIRHSTHSTRTIPLKRKKQTEQTEQTETIFRSNGKNIHNSHVWRFFAEPLTVPSLPTMVSGALHGAQRGGVSLVTPLPYRPSKPCGSPRDRSPSDARELPWRCGWYAFRHNRPPLCVGSVCDCS